MSERGVDQPKPAKLFPDEFLWGASTAGHQVEGGNYDQWTVWELAHATEMAKSADKRLGSLPAWQKFKAEAQTPANYISGKGVDHYHRFKEDFAIARKIGLNAFRFGIEWSRLEPEPGVWDQKEVDHYHNYIDEMHKAGLEPVLNLWHWTHPVWFEERGGFGRKENLSFWLKYVQKVADEFGTSVRYVITVNEPNIYVTYKDINKVNVPPEAPLPQRLLMLWRLVKAHKLAYRTLKRVNPDLQISAAVQMGASKLASEAGFLSKIVAWGADRFGNYLFYDRVKRQVDFVGFNFYFANYFKGTKLANPKSPVSDVGWYMEPGAIGEVIATVAKRYKKPIMITENGVADADDQYRQWWLKETTMALIKARQDGINIIGYMHWSLLDNFEWHQGWWPRFGLIKVDREHGMKRIVRPSAVWWSKQLAKIRE